MAKKGHKPPQKQHKLLALVCINASNMACHSVYSVLASFFPQAAHAKGLTGEPIGLVFAIFAAVVFASAPLVAPMLSYHGKRQVYVAGLATVSSATIAFAFADHINNPSAYLTWCLALRCVQGFGSALEETAAYALIAEIDPHAVSFNLGVTEVSTGLGYMIGPAIGGFLFAQGGFALPFVAIGIALLPAMLLILWIVPDDRLTGRQQAAAREEMAASTPMRQLLARPQILAIALTAILGNSDYAFLEPTLAGHVESIATSSTAVGMLFSVTSLTYTLSAPLMGWLSHKERMGPRNVIIWGARAGSAARRPLAAQPGGGGMRQEKWVLLPGTGRAADRLGGRARWSADAAALSLGRALRSHRPRAVPACSSSRLLRVQALRCKQPASCSSALPPSCPSARRPRRPCL